MEGVPSSHTVSLDVTGLPDFHEDRVDEHVEAVKKGGTLKWLRRLLPSPEEYKPHLLTDKEYIDKALSCGEDAVSLVNAPGWKDHKKGILPGDIVQTMVTEKYGKLFLLTGVVKYSAEAFLKEFHDGIESVCSWNPTILESKLIRKINDEVDITYQVSQGGGGGAVKPREFVNLRCSKKINEHYICCGMSIEYPGYPPGGKFIRAENKIGCWLTTPIIGEDDETCYFQWLMGCDLKGWIPQYVIDIAMPTALMDCLHYIRAFAANKKSGSKASGALNL